MYASSRKSLNTCGNTVYHMFKQSNVESIKRQTMKQWTNFKIVITSGEKRWKER